MKDGLATARAGLLLGLLIAGCAVGPTTETRAMMDAYVSAAHERLDACRAAGEDSSLRRSSCSESARLEVKQRFSEALAMTRHERGTSRYLREHYEQWTDAMDGLAAGARSVDAPQLAADFARIDALERKLR
jgi:hypothetical protein